MPPSSPFRLRCSQVSALRFISGRIVCHVSCIRSKNTSDFRKRRFSCGLVYVYLMTSRNEVVGDHLGLNHAWSPLLGSHNAAGEMWGQFGVS